jgi:hypothetical protein
MSDLTCPYCGYEQEVCHDDGFGYSEDCRHEVECGGCGKQYVFTTAISFTYFPAKADCLNDGNHEWKLSSTIPVRFSRWECQHCDAHKALTQDERARIDKLGAIT